MEPIANTNSNNTILTELEKAIHDEILAAYQYWAAAYLSQGPGKYDAEDIFTEHVQQELNHADMLAKRIVELGGDLPRDLQEVEPLSGTLYTISGRDVRSMAELIYNAEVGAVAKYTRIAAMARGVDPVTCKIVTEILATEQEHRYEIDMLRESL